MKEISGPDLIKELNTYSNIESCKTVQHIELTRSSLSVNSVTIVDSNIDGIIVKDISLDTLEIRGTESRGLSNKSTIGNLIISNSSIKNLRIFNYIFSGIIIGEGQPSTEIEIVDIRKSETGHLRVGNLRCSTLFYIFDLISRSVGISFASAELVRLTGVSTSGFSLAGSTKIVEIRGLKSPHFQIYTSFEAHELYLTWLFTR